MKLVVKRDYCTHVAPQANKTVLTSLVRGIKHKRHCSEVQHCILGEGDIDRLQGSITCPCTVKTIDC